MTGIILRRPHRTRRTCAFRPDGNARRLRHHDRQLPPGEAGPPLHLHPHTDEAFYVADGDATFLLGDREVPVTAGGLVFVPRGTAHTVRNSGDRAVRGLILISPGTAEHEFVPVDAG
jgi:mannose-6-phosphate isomerase-like protein (cupin superfamily)